jgi:AcrR family transcriptional regulator
MAIIVDKEKKRKDIALSCSDLLLKKGIRQLTVAEVAATAGVAKGSIYDYFANKEAIVFEIMRNYINDYRQNLYAQIDPDASTREKVFLLFDFVLKEDPLLKKYQNIYKEYISIELGSDNDEMRRFNTECHTFFRSVLRSFIDEGIEKGELLPQALSFIESILAAEKGFLIIQWTEDIDITHDVHTFLNALFDLLEVTS